MLTWKICTTGKGMKAPDRGKSAQHILQSGGKIRLRLLILTTVEKVLIKQK
jgi:hypothetical protein